MITFIGRKNYLAMSGGAGKRLIPNVIPYLKVLLGFDYLFRNVNLLNVKIFL